MNAADALARGRGFYTRNLARYFFRRPVTLRNSQPLISFTFDDFPVSALTTGGEILTRHGIRGTYYAAFSLMGQDSPVGRIFAPSDLPVLRDQGHELGCHTFAHSHSWITSPNDFDDSITANARALRDLVHDATFRTFSYPLHCPRPRTKLVASTYFDCCRCGGQTFNSGVADLNHLDGYFLEQSGGHFASVRDVIDRNAAANGWLIFATHDVSEHHTPYGCTPEFFSQVVKCAIDSGAAILSVAEACRTIVGSDERP